MFFALCVPLFLASHDTSVRLAGHMVMGEVYCCDIFRTKNLFCFYASSSWRLHVKMNCVNCGVCCCGIVVRILRLLWH